MELGVLGLEPEEEQAYAALVSAPHATAAELAAVLEVSVAVAARRLAGLVRRQLATRAGRPVRYLAAPPDLALTALVRHREQELDAARGLVHHLAEAHREAGRMSHPDIAVEVLTDLGAISEAAHRLTAQAQGEVRAFDRPPYVNRPGDNLQSQLDRQADGVTHRVVYSQAAVAYPGRLQRDIIPSVRSGERARVRPDLPLKLIIRDDQDALMPFSLAPGGHQLAYLVHRSPLLTALEALFEAEWERAVVLDPARLADGAGALGGLAGTDGANGADDGPDEESRALLMLLTTGMTDAAIARAQGWSPRTTQRRIQRVMTTLGATTRFQAALIASRRGWL